MKDLVMVAQELVDVKGEFGGGLKEGYGEGRRRVLVDYSVLEGKKRRRVDDGKS